MRFGSLLMLPLLAMPLIGLACSDDEEEAIVATSADVRERFDMLVSVFEKDTPVPDYAYIENLGDGRGYTCGWMGLVTNEYEVDDLVHAYTIAVPGNGLSGYLTELDRLAAANSGETTGLPGFENAWRAASSDPLFQDEYDGIVDADYFEPAMGHLQTLGFSSNLAKFILYDAIIQHGEGDDPDGLPAMISRTNLRVTPSAATEATWCSAFLDVRYETLTNPADASTAAVWLESRPRVDVQRGLIAAGNWKFDPPIVVDNGTWNATIN